MSAQAGNRITVIDTMKGLAMIFVIFDHCGYGLHPIIDHIEVPVFYLISGYLFSIRADFWTFLRRKVYTLLVPYMVFALLYAVPYMSRGIEATWAGHIFNLMVRPANYPLWFIKALFWGLTGYYWLLRPISDRPVWVEAAVNMVIAVVVCALVPLVSLSNIVLSTGITQGLEAIPLIGFGHIAARMTAEYHVKDYPKVYAIILATAIAAAYFTSIEGIGLNVSYLGEVTWLFYPSAVSCGVVFAAVCWCITWLTPLNYVGRQSVTFFGFHAIAIFLLMELVDMPDILMPLAAALLCVPVAMAWQKLDRRG